MQLKAPEKTSKWALQGCSQVSVRSGLRSLPAKPHHLNGVFTEQQPNSIQYSEYLTKNTNFRLYVFIQTFKYIFCKFHLKSTCCSLPGTLLWWEINLDLLLLFQQRKTQKTKFFVQGQLTTQLKLINNSVYKHQKIKKPKPNNFSQLCTKS